MVYRVFVIVNKKYEPDEFLVEYHYDRDKPSQGGMLWQKRSKCKKGLGRESPKKNRTSYITENNKRDITSTVSIVNPITSPLT